jgi:hypothetical protein
MRASVSLPRCVRGFACCALVVLATGCAQLVPQTFALRTGWPEGVTRSIELTSVPFFPQEDYQCGPASLATVMAFSGAPVTAESLVPQVYLPERHGSLQLEMLATPRRYSLVSYLLAPRYADMLREVAAGNPVIVLQDVGPMFTQWHYAVVNGFDYPSGTIYLRSGTRSRQEMPFTAFEREWMKSHYWAMVVVPPDRIPASASEDGWIQAVLAMARTGSPQAVTTAYEAALKRWPANLPAAIGLANQYHQKRDYTRAVAVLRTAQQRHPESVIVKNNLAQALSDGGRNAEALTVIETVAADADAPFAAEVRATRQLIQQRLAQQRTGNRR